MHYVNEQQHFVTISPAMTEGEGRHPEPKAKDLFFVLKGRGSSI
jgi:hypothetical protein